DSTAPSSCPRMVRAVSGSLPLRSTPSGGTRITCPGSIRVSALARPPSIRTWPERSSFCKWPKPSPGKWGLNQPSSRMPASPASTVICSTPAILRQSLCRVRQIASGEVSRDPQSDKQRADGKQHTGSGIGKRLHERAALVEHGKIERECRKRLEAAEHAGRHEQPQFGRATEAPRQKLDEHAHDEAADDIDGERAPWKSGAEQAKRR